MGNLLFVANSLNIWQYIIIKQGNLKIYWCIIEKINKEHNIQFFKYVFLVKTTTRISLQIVHIQFLHWGAHFGLELVSVVKLNLELVTVAGLSLLSRNCSFLAKKKTSHINHGIVFKRFYPARRTRRLVYLHMEANHTTLILVIISFICNKLKFDFIRAINETRNQLPTF